MIVARYWIRAEAATAEGWSVFAWGWSETSVEQAAERAEQKAARQAKSLDNHTAWENRDERDYYPISPPREKILQELADRRGEVVGTVTRNRYGSLILNARDLLFIDVDLPWGSEVEDPPERPHIEPRRGFFEWLFGIEQQQIDPVVRERDDPAPEDPPELQGSLQELADSLGESMRLYRTKGGYRLALTGRPVPTDDEESQRLLTHFGSDWLYAELCDKMACYRSRLTPKYWRTVGGEGTSPPVRATYTGDDFQEERLAEWEADYETWCEGYATCRLVSTHGRGEVHADLAPLVALHDRMTRIDRPELPLA